MKYYILKNSIDIKEIGCSDQVTTLPNGYNMNAPYSIWGIPLFGKIEPPIRFPDFKVRNNRAILTDFPNCVQTSSQWLLFSSRVWDVIKELNLPEYQVFPVKVYERGMPYDYFSLFFPLEEGISFIDWNASKFQLSAVEKETSRYLPVGEVSFKTFSDFVQTRFFLRAGNGLFPNVDFQEGGFDELRDKLLLQPSVINFSKKIDFDLFRIRGPILGHCASERFKKTIQENNLTGFRFLPLPGAEK